MKWMLLSALVLATALIALGNASSLPTIVDANGYGDYEEIMQAVDNSSAGNTIWVYDGLYVENVWINHTLTIYGNGTGTISIEAASAGDIMTVNGENVTVHNMTVSTAIGSGSAVLVSGANMTIRDCLIVDGNNNCIEFDYADDCLVVDTEVKDSGTGIEVVYSDDLQVLDCSINGIWNYGIYNQQSSHGVYRNVTFEDEAFNYATGSYLSTSTIDNCTVHGSPIMLHVNEADVVYDDADIGQILMYNCDDAWIGNLTLHNATTGIFLSQCDRVNMLNLTLKDLYRGIHLQTSHDCVLNGSHIHNTSSAAIAMSGSLRMTILDLDAHNTGGTTGIQVYSGCDDLILRNSSFRSYGTGINYFSWDGMFDNCTFWSVYTGINIRYYDGSEVIYCDFIKNDNAVYLNDVEWITVQNCSIRECTGVGIVIDAANNNTITYNELFDNDDYGIGIYGDSWDNVVHHNNFMDNGERNGQLLDLRQCGGCRRAPARRPRGHRRSPEGAGVRTAPDDHGHALRDGVPAETAEVNGRG